MGAGAVNRNLEMVGLERYTVDEGDGDEERPMTIAANPDDASSLVNRSTEREYLQI